MHILKKPDLSDPKLRAKLAKLSTMWNQIQNFISDNRLICGVLTVTSALLLAGALLGQYVGGLEPCSLCVIQRYPHFAVIIFGWLGYKRGL